MTVLDRCRQAALVVLVAACLIAAPGIASARFSALVPPTPTLKVSSAQMVAPTNVVGTYLCNPPGKDSIDLTIASFTDAGPGADAYVYTLASDEGTSLSVRSTLKSQVLSDNPKADGNGIVWTVTVQTALANWSSPTWTRTIVCEKKKTSTGPL